jgi:hypothetical protein
MALVIIQTPPLSASQKRRIGDRIVESLHGEGVPASSVVVLFQPDNSDVYLDGGLVHEVLGRPTAPQFAAPEPEAKVVVAHPEAGEEFKSKARRTRQELGDLRKRLVMLLEDQGGLSSFKAQEDLGLKDCEWAPATLRRLFGELEEEGLIMKQGQKRGTRYVWKGTAGFIPSAPAAKLVKRDPIEADGAFPGDAEPE